TMSAFTSKRLFTTLFPASSRLTLPRYIKRCPFILQQTLFKSTIVGSKAADIDHKRVQVKLSESLKPLIPSKDLVFGRNFTDHMLTVEWNDKDGWSDPIIQPYGKISLEPSAM
ncbi:16817_t:CDS:2, partial [Dentiscutata heterogama]